MSASMPGSWSRRAHPRRCGEHCRHRCPDRGLGGLTPAGAGNIASGACPVHRPGAHPRRCGEHRWQRPPHHREAGSPPQVRGTFTAPPHRRDTHGLTPAGAGNIRWRRSPHCRHAAHPRRCGEHLRQSPSKTTWSGSPPQVRGTCPRAVGHCAAPGLTPAGAGNIAI